MNNKTSPNSPGESPKKIEKPTLFRSQSLYDDRATKHNSSPPTTSHLAGSAKLSRQPSMVRQTSDLFRRNSSRFGKLQTTPGSPTSFASIGSSHPSSIGSVQSLALLPDQRNARYIASEKAYIKKMHNQYSNEYATKAIETREKYLDIGEDESEMDSEYEFDDYAPSTSMDSLDLMTSLKDRSLSVPYLRMQLPPLDRRSRVGSDPGAVEELGLVPQAAKPVASVTLQNVQGSIKTHDNGIIAQEKEEEKHPKEEVKQTKEEEEDTKSVKDVNTEFVRIFGDADAEEEEEINEGYSTEISRINSDEAFQIDDNIILPIVQSHLRPNLLDDQRFLERFEWQIMLRVVVKSDIVTDEKNRMMKKLNFGISEELSEINFHGNSYVRNLREQNKRNIWLALRARQFGHTIEEHSQILQYSRSLMDEFIEDVLKFRYRYEDARKEYYRKLIMEGALGDVDESVLDGDYINLLPLSNQQSYLLFVRLYGDCLNIISEILKRYDDSEQLWMSHKEMLAEKPVTGSEEYTKKLDTLINWSNIIKVLYTEKASLIKWFMTQTYYRTNLAQESQQKEPLRHTSSNSSSRGLDADHMESRSADDDSSAISESSEIERASHGVFTLEEAQMLARTCDVNDLCVDMFAENVLAYKNLEEVMENNVFSVINPCLKRAKTTYLSSISTSEELSLPSFFPMLMELVRFPLALMKKVIKVRLKYARDVTSQTLMGIDQTIYDFKVIIKLYFEAKEYFFQFISGIPSALVQPYELDFDEMDDLTLDMTDFLMVLYYRKLLASSPSHHFTTYKEAEVLRREWDFLKNIGYFLEENPGFKVSRNFLFLTSSLIERLNNYMEFQLGHPSTDTKVKFIQWYTTTFDNYNNVKRDLTRLTNGALKLVQNSLFLFNNAPRETQNHQKISDFLVSENFTLVSFNEEENIFDYIYNKGKRDADKPKKVFFLFASEELEMASDKDILGTLQGSKLGADPQKPLVESLKVVDVNGLLRKQRPGAKTDDIDKSSSEDDVVSLSKQYSKSGFVLVCPISRGHFKWSGKVRNIQLSKEKSSSLSKLVHIKYGSALLVTHGSPANLVSSKMNLINKLKRYFVKLCKPPASVTEKFSSLSGEPEYYDKLFDTLELPTDLDPTRKLMLTIIQTLTFERACSLLLIQKQLITITKRYNKLSFTMMEKGLWSKDKIVAMLNPEDPDHSILDFANSLFYVLRDTSLLSLRSIEASEKKAFFSLMIQSSIEWITLIVDQCISTKKKTFRWCVSALEYAVLIFQKFNVLLLTDEQFLILKEKVAGCLSLLISHFDIMGARSNKADKELYSYSKLQKKAIQKEARMALHKYSELSEKIIQLDQMLDARRRARGEVGLVLDQQKSENQFLTYLSTNFRRFNYKWQRGELLGQGSFGSVYIATELTNGNVMAVKEVKFPNTGTVSDIGRIIKDEMSVLEMLDHPNIVHYHGVEVHSDKVYLFMEYCDAGSLGGLLKYGKVAEEKLLQWYTFQLVEGLAYLHSKNVVHRDIKPENILLTSKGVIKFVDFGAAKLIISSGKTRSFMTIDGEGGVAAAGFGTPMYMSPESIIAGENAAKQELGPSDIWALGCCVLEMATARRPWSKIDNEFALMFHIANGNKPDLPEDELSKGLISFLKRCFEVSPEKRATADELLNDPWLAETRAESMEED